MLHSSAFYLNIFFYQEQDEDVLKHLTDVRLIFTGNKDNGSEDSEMV